MGSMFLLSSPIDIDMHQLHRNGFVRASFISILLCGLPFEVFVPKSSAEAFTGAEDPRLKDGALEKNQVSQRLFSVPHRCTPLLDFLP